MRLRLTAVLVSLAVLGLAMVGCASHSAGSAVDRHDPESVLRAYFSAWERGDWSAQASFMAPQYSRMVPEPLDSLRIDKLAVLEESSTRCLFEVDFEVKVTGEGVSMSSGEYPWTYELTWDPGGQSWLITNYGAG